MSFILFLYCSIFSFLCSILSNIFCCFVFFSLGDCIVCLSSIYSFWLSLWYLTTLVSAHCHLSIYILYVTDVINIATISEFMGNIAFNLEIITHKSVNYKNYKKNKPQNVSTKFYYIRVIILFGTVSTFWYSYLFRFMHYINAPYFNLMCLHLTNMSKHALVLIVYWYLVLSSPYVVFVFYSMNAFFSFDLFMVYIP